MGIFSEIDMDIKAVTTTAEEVEIESAAEPQPLLTESQIPVQTQASVSDEDIKRKAHEAAEIKRKAEWEETQQAKKAAEEAEILRISNMTDADVMTSSMKRISDDTERLDTERLTRRNMKECIAEYIQTLCLSDPVFARKALHPRKSKIHCIWFINRKAQEYAEHEMKDNGLKPDRNGIYGCDVPDDLCYQWAEEYFNDPDAKEDHDEDEKFVSKPYIGGHSKGKAKKQTAKKPEIPQKKVSVKADQEQITFGDYGTIEVTA